MIGVVGPETEAARIADAVEEAGGAAVTGDASAIADAATTAIVAVGQSSLVDVVGHAVEVPVLPVDVDTTFDPGFETVAEAVDRLLDGEYGTDRYPVLDVRHGEERADRALFDVMLDTAEPGRISEYGVRADGASDRFRADGVVVATPVGSRGYASTAGGPLLAPDVAAVGVVPIAAFELHADPQVLAPPISLTVERDETPVALRIDGREVGPVGPERPVQVSVGDELRVVDARS